MKSIFFYVTICVYFLFLASCGKAEEKNKCDECVIKLYNCGSEGGEVRWTVNGKNEVVSAGYFTANQGSWGFPPQTQQYFNFAGDFSLCDADISGSTASSDKVFSVGSFRWYIPTARFKDFCGKSVSIGGGQNGFLEITSYDGLKASGKFYMHQKTGGATQCKPDEWEIEGSFKDIPVY